MKLTVTGEGTHTTAETSILDNLTDAITSPLKALNDDAAATTYYSESSAAQMQLAGMAVGVFVGDKFGHKIPLLGQRRDAWNVG